MDVTYLMLVTLVTKDKRRMQTIEIIKLTEKKLYLKTAGQFDLLIIIFFFYIKIINSFIQMLKHGTASTTLEIKTFRND
ncbi:hypothetical protein BpHYR1_034868 [Brachionus plicatilis]|uniref:Uncharacterized protein n=1 Tax=Brachionus plicatilis TaxID=10195 RepID=A0A3M7SHG5_BRAPC|nr:hypothetical protein BpHYR1_034868 [Brachionus plicatilis]